MNVPCEAQSKSEQHQSGYKTGRISKRMSSIDETKVVEESEEAISDPEIVEGFERR